MKVKVTLVKLFILTVDQLLILKCSSRSKLSQGQGHIKVKVTQSRLLWVKATQGQGHSRSLKVKVISWSRSSQGHSHFEVKVILESNGNVFQFLSQSRQLAFVQMLIITCLKQVR